MKTFAVARTRCAFIETVCVCDCYTANSSEQTVELPDGDDSDICEPLSTTTVCHSLNDSQMLCQPSRWAGDAIQDAINATQSAMRSLRTSIHAPPLASRSFLRSSSSSSSSSSSLSSAPTDRRRRRNAPTPTSSGRQPAIPDIDTGNAATPSSSTDRGVDKNDQSEFHFRLSATVAAQLAFVVGLSLVFRSAAGHVTRYRASDTYANRYFASSDFRRLDDDDDRCTSTASKSTAGGGGGGGGAAMLLPLRSHEKPYVADVDRWALSRFEHRLQRRRLVGGVTLACVQLLVSAACIGFDQLVGVVLDVVASSSSRDGGGRHADDEIRLFGGVGDDISRNEDVVAAVIARRRGDGGLLDELLGTMIESWQTRRPDASSADATAAAANPTVCVPVPVRRSTAESIGLLGPLVALHVLLVLGVAFRARFLRARDRIAGYYYPRRADERRVALCTLIETRRRRLPVLLSAIARRKHRRRRLRRSTPTAVDFGRTPATVFVVPPSVASGEAEIQSSSSTGGAVRRLASTCCGCSGDGRHPTSPYSVAAGRGCLVCDRRGGDLVVCRKQQPMIPPTATTSAVPSTSSTTSAGLCGGGQQQASSSLMMTTTTTSCGARRAASFSSASCELPVQFCQGAFCAECWIDLGRTCPLCDDVAVSGGGPGADAAATGGERCFDCCGDLDYCNNLFIDSDDEDDDVGGDDVLQRRGAMNDVYL